MKISFDTQACLWLHARISDLVRISGKREDTRAVSRIASKMRYKFHGAPSMCFLTMKERHLLAEIVTYTMDNSPNEQERATAARIARALMTRGDESNESSNDNIDSRESES